MAEQSNFSRRDKQAARTSCRFCGCKRDEATLRRVRSEQGERERICTDCLSEPETAAWMQAGAFVVA